MAEPLDVKMQTTQDRVMFHPEQLRWLEKMFPECLPKPSDNMNDLMYRGGQRSVLECIRARLK